MLAFHCAGIDYLFAYSYDDLIEFVRFPHLFPVVGCLALGSIVSFFGLILVHGYLLRLALIPFLHSPSVFPASGFIHSNRNFNFLWTHLLTGTLARGGELGLWKKNGGNSEMLKYCDVLQLNLAEVSPLV